MFKKYKSEEHSLAKEGEQNKSGLRLARLLVPEGKNKSLAEIVGIPFELSQLEKITISYGDEQIKLVDLMQKMNLISEAIFPSHLSVGADKRNSPHNIARSYFFPEMSIGVKGMGMISYRDANASNDGFGLDRYINRTSGAIDVGGGVTKVHADYERKDADFLYQLTTLHLKKQIYARVYDVLPLFNFVGIPYGITVRDDGKRGVRKEYFVKQILEVLPILSEVGCFSTSAFDANGHNVFLKGKNPIFTDYEGTYRAKFGDAQAGLLGKSWYIKYFRANFNEFCKSFGFKQTPDHLGKISFNLLHKKLKNLMFVKEIPDEDRFRFERIDLNNLTRDDIDFMTNYAITYVIVMRSQAIKIGLGYLRAEVRDILENRKSSSQIDATRLKRLLYARLVKKNKNELSMILKRGHGIIGDHDATCKIVLSGNDIFFDVGFDNMCLPILSQLSVKIDDGRLYSVCPTSDDNISAVKFDNIPEKPNLVDDKNVIYHTLYSTIINVFSMHSRVRLIQGTSKEEVYIDNFIEEVGLPKSHQILPYKLTISTDFLDVHIIGNKMKLVFYSRVK